MDERGGGLVQLWAGFFVFLAMLLFAYRLNSTCTANSSITRKTENPIHMEIGPPPRSSTGPAPTGRRSG